MSLQDFIKILCIHLAQIACKIYKNILLYLKQQQSKIKNNLLYTEQRKIFDFN